MKTNDRNFNQILLGLRDQNMKTLMSRARIANRIAKSATPAKSKNRAYKVKVKTLQGLKRFFPEQVRIDYDFLQGSEIVLVSIPKQGFGLHAPANSFALEA